MSNHPSISYSHINTIAPREAERTTAATTPTTPRVSAFAQRLGATRPTHRCRGNTATFLGVNDTTRLSDQKVGCSVFAGCMDCRVISQAFIQFNCIAVISLKLSFNLVAVSNHRVHSRHIHRQLFATVSARWSLPVLIYVVSSRRFFPSSIRDSHRSVRRLLGCPAHVHFNLPICSITAIPFVFSLI